jgi:methionyl-tRNA synthetase
VKFLDQLGMPAGERDFAALGPDDALKPGTAIVTPQPIFPRFVEDETRAAE